MTTLSRPAASERESRSDRLLCAQVSRFFEEVDALPGLSLELDTELSGSANLESCDRAVSSATAALLAHVGEPVLEDFELRDQVVATVLRSIDLSGAIHQRLAAHRTTAYALLRQGLDRLRRISDSTRLLDRVCPEIVESCGFDRVLLTRVENDEWLPWMAHFPDNTDLEHRITEWMTQQRFPVSELGQDLLEMHPVLVKDANEDPRGYKSMIDFSETRRFVAAPVTPSGKLIGVIYADRLPSGRVVDELDRDLLWAFAADFGRMYERVTLIERMHAQQSRIERAFGSAETMMDALANTEIELTRTPEARLPGGTDEPEMAVPPAPPDISELLTTREAEVLALMVRGASNATIAQRLIIKEGTVKSHVKHILRKLDAINRSEAISRYIGRV